MIHAVNRIPVRLTEEGRRQIEDELARCEAEAPVVSMRLSEARAGGNDPSENLDLRDAMDDLVRLESRIGDLRSLLASAEPMGKHELDGTVHLGDTVRLRDDTGDESTYILVSPAEADPRRGRISEQSPIGRVLVGRRAGEQVVAETPGGPMQLDILAIE